MEIRKLPVRKLNASEEVSRVGKFWSALKHASIEYAKETKVNGFFYLRVNENSIYTRFFWTIIIIVSFFFGLILLANLIKQFLEVPFLMSFMSPSPLLTIPFPSVSICHPQTVINYKALKFIDKIKMPDGVSKEDVIENLATALGIFTENQWAPVDERNLSMINDVLEFNQLTVFEAVKEVGIVGKDCVDFILRCSFNKKRFPCFQDSEHFTWRTTLSYIGICCSFNYNPCNASYEPLRINSFGVRGGLTFIGTSFPHVNDGQSGLLFSDGFFLLMHPPGDFPTDLNEVELLQVGKISSVAIYPIISQVSDDVKELSYKSRRCLIGSDVGENIYRQPACAVSCMREFIYEKCGCHPYYIPRQNSDIRDCRVADGHCFGKILFDVKKTRCSACLPACDDITYTMSSSVVSYSFLNTSVNPIYDQTDISQYEFTAHIYFANSRVPVQRKIISLSFIQLLSNFGGVFNLCLGLSLISVVELVYFFGIKVMQYINRRNIVVPITTTVNPMRNWFQ